MLKRVIGWFEWIKRGPEKTRHDQPKPPRAYVRHDQGELVVLLVLTLVQNCWCWWVVRVQLESTSPELDLTQEFKGKLVVDIQILCDRIHSCYGVQLNK